MNGQKLLPYKGLQMDSNYLYIEDAQTPFIKNLTYNDSLGMFTPVLGNEIYDPNFILPEGNNMCIGSGIVEQLGHTYVFVKNSAGNDCIYRIKASEQEIEIVSVSQSWKFSSDPSHYIAGVRFASYVFSRYSTKRQKEEMVTYIFFCDDLNFTRFLCVEDCIATSTFTAPNGYFNLPGRHIHEDIVCLGVPTPLDCITVAEIPRDNNDVVEIKKQNRIVYKGWQFRVKYINVWGQDSEHGVISTQYLSVSGQSGIDNSQSLPRLLKLIFSSGGPTIDKVQIEFRNYTGNEIGFSVDSDWYLYDTIDLYKNENNKDWWERDRNSPWKKYYDEKILAGDSIDLATKKANSRELFKYNNVNNTIEYIFSASKQWTPLPVQETNRIENYLPLTSGGIFSVYKNIGLINNKRGFPKLSEDILSKIKFNVISPDPEPESCKLKLRKITIWGVIYNPQDLVPIHIRPDDVNVVFGHPTCTNNNAYSYLQVLPKNTAGVNQEGIIGCLRGTKFYAISRQYSYNTATQELKDVGINYVQEPNTVALQKWEFNVIPGAYVFQIASHRSLPTDDYSKTSTNTIGRTAIGNIGVLVNREREVYIDCSQGDVSIWNNPFMIYDLTRLGGGCAFADATSVTCGYVYEDQVQKRPITGASIGQNVGTQAYSSVTTDHNGYFFTSARQNHLTAYIFGIKNGIKSMIVESQGTSDTPFSNHFKFANYYVYNGIEEYKAKDRILIKGRIALCSNSNIGIAGILVVMQGGGFATTDSNGSYTIVSHDRMRPTDSTNVNDHAVDNSSPQVVFVSQKGVTIITSCNNGNECNYSFAINNVQFPIWNDTQRIVTPPLVSALISNLNKRGPTMGGKYQLSVFTEDWLGRVSFAQSLDSHIVDIPTLQETKSYSFSKIGFEFLPGITFPPYVRKLSFAITENLAFSDSISWVAERVQYIDNSGGENKESPTFIRFYYESLSEYNKLLNFSSTVGWQFITDNEAVIAGDTVQVCANGDGVIMDIALNSLVTYDKDGKYIQIEYCEALKSLVNGCLLKIIRPTQSVQKKFVYELCPVIDIVNGVPSVMSGEFNYYDSYLLNRQIPVPVEKKKSKDQYGVEIITDTNVNETKNFPFYFEHHSPSDKWGYHCKTRGRVNVVNEFENEFRYGSEIAMSKSMTDNGVVNGLNYFREEDVERFDFNDWGLFTGVIPEIGFLLVICENNNFVTSYMDDSVRVDGKGNITARSADTKFGRPERKIGNNYGCKVQDINTIRKLEGVTGFLDRSKIAIVFHNYSEAKAISDNKVRNWLTQKINMVSNEQKYFLAGMDPRNKKYIISSFDLKDTYVNADFVNDKENLDVSLNETMSISILDGSMDLLSYTPEYYGLTLSDKYSTKQLITFKKGIPYKHYDTKTPFCNFFGIQCTPYVWGVVNIENTKIKKAQSIEVYCNEVMFIAYNILTSSGQISRILEPWWSKRELFFSAGFLCDINSRLDENNLIPTTDNKILDGDLLYGQWILVCMKVTDKDLGKYFEWTGNIINLLPSEKSSV